MVLLVAAAAAFTASACLGTGDDEFAVFQIDGQSFDFISGFFGDDNLDAVYGFRGIAFFKAGQTKYRAFTAAGFLNFNEQSVCTVGSQQLF